MTSWKEIKRIWGKIWYFIWEDDSIWSWLVNIILAFVLIKFIVYPGLGFLLGTSFPIVAVISESMEHDGSFDDWWNSNAVYNETKVTQSDFYSNYDITRDYFTNFQFVNGFNKGDIMILVGKKSSKLKIGDVIVYNIAERSEPIIHRIIKIEEQNGKYFFQTKGDHNEHSYPFEQSISEDVLLGKAVFKIPWFGYIKIAFLRFLSFLGFVSY